MARLNRASSLVGEGIKLINRSRNLYQAYENYEVLLEKAHRTLDTIKRIQASRSTAEQTLDSIERERQLLAEEIYKIINLEIYNNDPNSSLRVIESGAVNADNVDSLVTEIDAYINEIQMKISQSKKCSISQ